MGFLSTPRIKAQPAPPEEDARKVAEEEERDRRLSAERFATRQRFLGLTQLQAPGIER
jgi:hypothetical protein